MDTDQSDGDAKSFSRKLTGEKTGHLNAILKYLNQRGFQMMSYERIRQKIDDSLSDTKLDAFIDGNKSTFRKVKLKGNKKGLAKIIP